MSVGQFHSIDSSFHQQPLPSTSRIEDKGSVIPDEIIHQWNINDFVVSLIREQDSLKYKTTDKYQKEICTNYIEISEAENLEEMISYLKGSSSWFSEGLDNCFTWARKSVSMLDIKLGKNFHSQIFAWPRSFTDTIKEQGKNLFVDIKI